MSIPNIITFGRLLAVPAAVYLILVGDLGWAFWVVVGAGVSDALDGAIARMCRSLTALGAYLDPLADKVLLVSVFIALGHVNELPLWLVIVVVSRDIMIVGGVMLLYTLKEALVMQPSPISKINTAAQIALSIAVLAPDGLGLPDLVVRGVDVVNALVWMVLATTLLSGAGYLYRGGRLFNRHGGVK